MRELNLLASVVAIAAAVGHPQNTSDSYPLRSSGPKSGKTARRAKQKLAKKAKQNNRRKR